MSAHSFPKIDQKEYLKKYLSGNKAKKKKKDKKHKKSSAASIKVKIIDDDINHLDSGPDIDEELLLTGEDAPQIVGEYIEEQPGDRKVPKWKSIVIKDEPDEVNDGVKQNETDIWGHDSDKKRSIRTPDKSISRKKERKRNSSSASPPQRRRKSPSPPRKSKTDKSPSRIRKKGGSPDFRAKVKTEPQSPKCGSRDQTRDYSYKALSPRRRDSDHSPPRRGKSPIRKSRNRSPYQSPPRHKRDSDQSLTKGIKRQDNSPPRRKENSSFHSPKRLRRDSDQSPPRKNKISVHSPSRCRSDSDQSPPRRGKRRDSDRSIPRKSKNSYDSSLRRNRHERQTPDCSPTRKSQISPDQSPPRRRRNSDQSPPRKTKNVPSKHKHRSPDQSPSRRRKKSPVEICRNSPPTRVKREKQTPSPQLRRSRWEKQESDNSLSPPPTHKPKPGKTLEGKKAGLQDAKSLQKETMERRKQENILFEKMSADVSGRNAEVQVRATGRKGRRAREAAEEDPEERRRKEEHEAKKKLLYDRWGKGLKQIEDHKNRMLEQQYESSKPLARYSNDEDLERHLKEQERLEDPMLEYMRQKRKEKEKQSGKPQIPRYEGPYPENRFGIRPGYRWDGVDRSNGYEKKYFAVQNEKKARQDEAYKYSVEDM